MVYAEIISIGNELIHGVHVDLNAPMLASELLRIGIEVQRFTTVPDDLELLAQALVTASQRAQVVLITGGLGPTEDDVTRHAAAKAGGVSLEFVELIWQAFTEQMRLRGLRWSESSKLPAMFPKGATILPNGIGTAPGFEMLLHDAVLLFMPGPPSEAAQMLEQHVLPRLVQRFAARGNFCKKSLHMVGVAESVVGDKIAEQMKPGSNPQLGTTVRKGILSLHIFARSKAPAAAQQIAEQEAQRLQQEFAPYIFGQDGKTFAEAVGELLLDKKITIATAESCTGGLVGKILTDVPGISAVYKGGFIAYSNEMKQACLGVPAQLLEQKGAVSAEVAQAMAQGVAKVTGAQMGLATTGIAGPSGGSADQPVGLVYEAAAFRGKTEVLKRLYPPGDRKRIRELAARDTLNLARKLLSN